MEKSFSQTHKADVLTDSEMFQDTVISAAKAGAFENLDIILKMNDNTTNRTNLIQMLSYAMLFAAERGHVNIVFIYLTSITLMSIFLLWPGLWSCTVTWCWLQSWGDGGTAARKRCWSPMSKILVIWKCSRFRAFFSVQAHRETFSNEHMLIADWARLLCRISREKVFMLRSYIFFKLIYLW